MTCIVGLVDNGKVYMGGDSAGCAGFDLSIRADQKVFKNDDFIMGFTTSFRMGQLLRYDFSPPKYHTDVDIYKYMVTDFINEVRRCLKNGGYASKKDEEESAGTFLVGFKGQLFRICNDYQVGQNILPFDACGCGQSYALGSLHSTNETWGGFPKIDPQTRIEMALHTAQQFSAGVREPFHIEILE